MIQRKHIAQKYSKPNRHDYDCLFRPVQKNRTAYKIRRSNFIQFD